MKLGEALSKLKKEKSRLARLISLRKNNVYVEEGKQTPFDPQKLSPEINQKINGIRKLKIQVQKTNLETTVKGDNISLAEAIIKINDLRSKIAHLNKVFDQKSDWPYRSREKEQKENVPQLDEQEIEDEIERLVVAKVQLDNKIQMTNWITELQE